jgi:c-di-GMP-binding flagellar brake protein YcgR
MDRIDQEKKGRFMNIKERFYICKYKCENKLTDEQKILTDQYRNTLYDVAMTYMNTPTPT